ncbi:hypothetical protein KBX53_01960 [Micromonospora sp. M51]|uniref:hypothetical protein n=1 Tax=Micromonospora TaxID=1873 RepID=UPI000689F608|nr:MULTISPECIES: hypothetical protein [Micromonospora]MBQ1009741.1 hypothetical protein [Micromonospora sp. M51]
MFRRSLRAWLPLLLAGGWMLGTFGLFWTGALAQEVPNRGVLWLFVLSATGAFAVGYVAQLFRGNSAPRARTTRSTDILRARRLVLAGGIYYMVFGVALLLEYGATGPGSIIASLQDPAGAYLNKFTVYQQQEDAGRTNPVIQVLTLLGVLGTALVPLLVVYWRRLSSGLRLVGLAGIGVYSVFFLYIGTLKGLGDFVLMIAAGLLIASSRNPDRIAQRQKRRRATVLVAVVVVLFCGYMMSNQADRVDQFGTQDRVRANPTVERIAGEQVATGLAALVIYPTHGYLGLAYNLETPFTWSHGLGSTPAITSYAGQYLGIDADQYPAYPVRTEYRTGWPAGMYWATIYPWLASDLTFPGTVLFMALLGWFFARLWREVNLSGGILPILIFVQMCLLVAYIPANNQLGMSRPALIGVVTLLFLYVWTALTRSGSGSTPPARVLR